jgi:hypothetical protein
MKAFLFSALAAGLVAAGVAHADTVTLDFEGPTSYASILQYYNGGKDGANVQGPVPGYGISFGGDALVFKNDPNVSYPPANGNGVMTVQGPNAALNRDTIYGITFAYSSIGTPTITAYDGYNGTGNVVGSVQLVNNDANCDPNGPLFCNWTTVSLPISGIAKSIQFGTALDSGGPLAAFDNVVAAIPVPAAALLLPLGAAMLGVAGFKRRAPQA